MRLDGAVLFVRDLRRSQDFYEQLLELETQVSAPEMVLLAGAQGDHLLLRALPGTNVVARTNGVRRLLWTASDAEDLRRATRVLESSGPVVTESHDGLEVVEGLDPDRFQIALIYPGVPGVGAVMLPNSLYAY